MEALMFGLNVVVKAKMTTRIGVVSDTHGLLRPEVMPALADVDLILHAGDVGDEAILGRLRELAPVIAVRGNVDRGAWATRLKAAEVIEAGAHHLYMLHDLGALDLDPVAAGFSGVIYGHSHQPSIEPRGGVLYLNPGSAGPRRFALPVTLAMLTVAGDRLDARLIHLKAT